MERVVAIVFCAAIFKLVSNIESIDSTETDEALYLDQGILHINTTDATWMYSADGDAANLDEILRGSLEDREYADGNENQWPYQVALFRHNGSIVLAGSLRVSFSGQPAVSIESLQGDIEIATRLMLDGYLDLTSQTGSLGGYGEMIGPGGGGLLDGETPPKPPGGAGHGGTGGEAFKEIMGLYDPSTGGFVFEEKRYGYPYLIGDGYHLLGGSAGGKVEYAPSVLIFSNPKGGGALEITAKRKITIGGHISANGQMGIPYDNAFIERYSAEPCAGGGSGGLIRLRAREIEIRQDGYLSVTGGDGAQNTNTSVYCGGGGAGGIIKFQISDRVHGYLLGDHLFLGGGNGTTAGGAGIMEITTSQNGNDDDGDCDCNPSPLSTNSPPSTPSTVSPPEPPTACPTVDPSTCNCNESVTRPEVTSVTTCDCSDVVTCPTVTGTTECDCGKTACPTVPEMVTCNCQDSTGHGVTDDTTTEPSATKSLTPEVAAQFLEESLDVIGDMGENSTQEGAVRLLKDAETLGVNLGKQLAEGRQEGEKVTVSAATETIGMQVVVDDASAFVGVSFPDPNDPVFSNDTWRAPSLTQEVKGFLLNETSGYLIVVNILYNEDMGEILDGTPSTSGITPTVNSRVIGTTVFLSDNVTTDFTNSVRMTAEKLQKNISGTTSCVFWDFQARGSSGGAWSPVGCSLHTENDSHVVCVCDHLTNFAVLLMPDRVVLHPRDEFALGIISYIGLGLSLSSLLLAFITISVSLKSLKNFQSAVIHLNLIAALGLADLLFLIGADDTEDQMWCTAVAIMLHYFYLSTFMWMLCEGFYIYIRVTSVFAYVRGHLKFYFMAAWGIPAVIVGVTAGVNLQGYGTMTACWLDAAGNMIWAFASPVALIIAMNVFFLAMILYRFLTVKSIAKKSKYEQLKSSPKRAVTQLCSSLRRMIYPPPGPIGRRVRLASDDGRRQRGIGCCASCVKATRAAIVLLPLLGTTWIFGLVAFGSGNVVLFYVFVILNSLQGVFICIFHCLTNDDVASTLRIKLRRSRTKIDIFLTSTDRKSQQKSKANKTGRSNRTEAGTRRDGDGLSASTSSAQSTRWATLPPTSQSLTT